MNDAPAAGGSSAVGIWLSFRRLRYSAPPSCSVLWWQFPLNDSIDPMPRPRIHIFIRLLVAVTAPTSLAPGVDSGKFVEFELSELANLRPRKKFSLWDFHSQNVLQIMYKL